MDMQRIQRSLARIAVRFSLVSAAACGTYADRPSEGQVLAELSRRSELPEAELRRKLAHCDADPQSQYFCAYRGAVAADLALEFAVAAKKRQSPECESALGRAVDRFQHSRMRLCKESAADIYAEAAIAPTPQQTCIAAATIKMVEQVRHMSKCQLADMHD